jgi:uncharacterized protein (TIGR00369 family)
MIPPEPLPEVFRERFAGLVEQRHQDRPGDVFFRCFGCGPAHPLGLRVRCFKTDNGVISPIVIAAHWEGPPGAAHGGIVAAYLDEVLAGVVVAQSGRIAVTGELTVRYVKPVPLQAPLLGRAHVVGAQGRQVDAEGSIEEFASGRVVATGRGRFFVADASPPENEGSD